MYDITDSDDDSHLKVEAALLTERLQLGVGELRQDVALRPEICRRQTANIGYNVYLDSQAQPAYGRRVP